MVGLPHFSNGGSNGFQRVVDAFLLQPGLPFAGILSAERIERSFTKHGNLFGTGAIYSTAVMVWSFLSQVLRDLSCEVAAELEQAAEPRWRWKARYHAKLIDGFTFTMPDTPQNQAKYPQPKAQQPGVGLSIARAVATVSFATACAMDLAMGPYQGKETGESALLRSLLQSLAAGDIAVIDRYYCSFMVIALLILQGTDTSPRKHHLRHSDFRRGRRLGKISEVSSPT